MATVAEKRIQTGDQRIAFYATWDEYQALAQVIGDQTIRLSYDGERVELMSPGPRHENYIVLIARLVGAVTAVLGIPCKGMGSTHWVRPEARRAIEADTCFYLTAEKAAVARRRPKKSADWPLPDLAVEIDMSPSKLDRPGIYAALGVAEVWRFNGKTFRIDRLGPDGKYTNAAESAWLGIRPEEVVQLLALDVEDDNDFSNQVLAWAREVLAPRRKQA